MSTRGMGEAARSAGARRRAASTDRRRSASTPAAGRHRPLLVVLTSEHHLSGVTGPRLSSASRPALTGACPSFTGPPPVALAEVPQGPCCLTPRRGPRRNPAAALVKRRGLGDETGLLQACTGLAVARRGDERAQTRAVSVPARCRASPAFGSPLGDPGASTSLEPIHKRGRLPRIGRTPKRHRCGSNTATATAGSRWPLITRALSGPVD